MSDEILIISCYDCAYKFRTKVLKKYDDTLNDVQLSISDSYFYDLVCLFDSYIYNGGKLADYYLNDENYKVVIKEFYTLLKNYNNIILCEDGDIVIIKHEKKIIR